MEVFRAFNAYWSNVNVTRRGDKPEEERVYFSAKRLRYHLEGKLILETF